MRPTVNRRSVITGGASALLLMSIAPAANGANTSPAAGAVDGDAELDALVADLEALPVWLQQADPRTTPNYEQTLSRALGGRKVIDGPGITGSATARVASGWRCSLEVAKVVVSYGVPVAKVVSWIRQARKIWGGFKGILAAIRSGNAAAEIGPEAAAVLEGILGYGAIKEHCF